MADGMGPFHGAKPETFGDLLRPAHLLEQCHTLAAPDDIHCWCVLSEPLLDLGHLVIVDPDHGVGVVQRDIGVDEGAVEVLGGVGHRVGRSVAQSKLGLAVPALAVDGEACAVGSAVRQSGEHGLGQAAEFGLESGVF
jgi:hypothetical protein